MSTPRFSDFEKACRDLFEGDFCSGRLDVKLSSRANNGAEFEVGTKSVRDENSGVKSCGSLETRIQCKAHGLTVTEKWCTDNVLTSKATVKDRPVHGMTTSAAVSFMPTTGQRSYCLDMAVARRKVHTTVEIEGMSVVRGSSAFRLGSFLLGGKFQYEPSMGGITDAIVGLAYQGTDFTAGSRLLDGQRCVMSLHHRLSPSRQWGVQCGWDFGSSDTNLDIAMRSQIDRGSFWKAKVNNKGRFSVCYGHMLSEDLQACLSADVNFLPGGQMSHRLGVGIEFES